MRQDLEAKRKHYASLGIESCPPDDPIYTEPLYNTWSSRESKPTSESPETQG